MKQSTIELNKTVSAVIADSILYATHTSFNLQRLSFSAVDVKKNALILLALLASVAFLCISVEAC